MRDLKEESSEMTMMSEEDQHPRDSISETAGLTINSSLMKGKLEEETSTTTTMVANSLPKLMRATDLRESFKTQMRMAFNRRDSASMEVEITPTIVDLKEVATQTEMEAETTSEMATQKVEEFNQSADQLLIKDQTEAATTSTKRTDLTSSTRSRTIIFNDSDTNIMNF